MVDQRQPPLGRNTNYPEQYDAGLLFPIPRSTARDAIGIAPGQLPFYGMDSWTAYELSWLNPKGLPQVAIAEFQVPCTSTYIVESKSLKLYLNSLNQTRFDSRQRVREVLARDLGAGFGGPVTVILYDADGAGMAAPGPLAGTCLDKMDIECADYTPRPDLLGVGEGAPVAESLYSHLLKTNCPVTGQPDWASIHIAYRGKPICREGLLGYIVSYRRHQDFHEQCVERIYLDIMKHCGPEELTVYARYTRRGGLDINPWRSSLPNPPDWQRVFRQ